MVLPAVKRDNSRPKRPSTLRLSAVQTPLRKNRHMPLFGTPQTFVGRFFGRAIHRKCDWQMSQVADHLDNL